MPQRYAALLKGVNVGGRHKLPMKELVALFEELGCTEVVSYIQSGNVVFRADANLAARVSTEIDAAVQRRFGFPAPTTLRTASEMDAIVSANPLLRPDAQPEQLHVAFLLNAPAPKRAALLEPDRFLPEEFALRDRELYLYLPYGAGKTKIPASYFESRLKVSATARNWRTVLALQQMLHA